MPDNKDSTPNPTPEPSPRPNWGEVGEGVRKGLDAVNYSPPTTTARPEAMPTPPVAAPQSTAQPNTPPSAAPEE